MIKQALFLTVAILVMSAPVYTLAQAATTKVVSACNTQVYVAGKMQYPTQDTAGNACFSGILTGAVSFGVTASASPTPVTAGTGRALNENLFSGLRILPITPGGVDIDLSGPSGVFGLDGATVMSVSNPFSVKPVAQAVTVIMGSVGVLGADGATIATTSNPSPVQLQTQTDTVMVGGHNTKEINGVAPLMGQGATGTGAQRVTQSDDITSVTVSVSTATTTQIVAASGSLVIHVKNWNLVTTLADNVTWESGDTGGSCANPVALTGAYPFAANGGASVGTGAGDVLKLPSGKALCMLTSAATQISGSVAYTQY